MTTTITKQCLMKMKDYLQEHGWVQRQFESNTGACCLMGAYYRACENESPYSHRLLKKQEKTEALSKVLGTDFIPYWNDEPGRTEKEVFMLLDKAIANAPDA